MNSHGEEFTGDDQGVWWRSGAHGCWAVTAFDGNCRIASSVLNVTGSRSLRGDSSTNPDIPTMKPVSLRPFLPRPAIRRRTCFSRLYAIQASGSPSFQVFNRHTKYLQKERAAADVERSRQVDYLRDEVAMRLSERLLVCDLANVLTPESNLIPIM